MIDMKRYSFYPVVILMVILIIIGSCKPPTLWDLANKNKDILKISTIFTAQDVRNKLSTVEGLDSAITWCKNTGVTRVFIESFRGGYTAEKETLLNAKNKFAEAGVEPSGCVTTTQMGKYDSTGSRVSCYTSEVTHNELVRIFEYTASMFDVIMIDDFLFTGCECEECRAGKGDRTWAEYRCDLLNEVSKEYILKPAKKVNSNAKVIIKYPQWYDNFHNRGYEVVGETESYDIIWVGTESRDNDFINNTPGLNTPQYESYFIMRWLGEIGGEKTGGGWFDALGTTPKTYVEQARQTVLADAREMMLFSYGGLNRETNRYGQRDGTGVADVEALRIELPGLFKLAKLIHNKPIKGVTAVKPPNSDPHLPDTARTLAGRDADAYIYDFVGMVGLPLVPTAKIDTEAEAAFFPIQSLKDPDFKQKLSNMLTAGKPVLITDGLASRLDNPAQYENLTVLNVNIDTKNVLKISREELKSIRDKMLKPFGLRFDAPAMVALYLIGDDVIVIENFNDSEISVSLESDANVNASIKLTLPENSVLETEFTSNKLDFRKIPARTLVAVGL
jgi:hypothetical protein